MLNIKTRKGVPALIQASLWSLLCVAALQAAAATTNACSSIGDGSKSCDFLINPASTFMNFSGVTDPSGAGVQKIISDASGDVDFHRVWRPTMLNAVRNQSLVVFLPGANANTDQYEEISSYIAGLGYYTINLSYRNRPGTESSPSSLGAICSEAADLDACYFQLRYEIAYGYKHAYVSGMGNYRPFAQPGNMDPSFRITTPDSIVGRLVNALYYLKMNDATDGGIWNTFLKPDPACAGGYHARFARNSPCFYPNWNKIIVAGHSSGAGQAAFLGVHTPAISGVGLRAGVKRVVMFSAPNDFANLLTAASWIKQDGFTAAKKYWGFVNANEQAFSQCASRNWGILIGSAETPLICDSGREGSSYGITSYEASVGTSGAPASSTTAHFLVTTKQNDSDYFGQKAHISTAGDNIQGIQYPSKRKAAWQYLITAGKTE